MLEAKICEAGPGDKRPNPVSLNAALQRLVSAHKIQIIPKRTANETPFYASTYVDITTESFQAVLDKRRHLYLIHKGLADRNEYCSEILERIVDSALVRSGVVSEFVTRFPNPNVPRDRPLDFVVRINDVLWGGEDKNYREWLYPESWEIWSTISKCCEIDAVPILIARKIPYVSFLFFGKAGMVGFQTHFQYFHPTCSEELARVKDVDGLGYKDISCTLEPPDYLIRFLSTTIPRIGPDFQRRFSQTKDVLLHFCDDEHLRDKTLHPRRRKQVFSEAWKAIVGGDLTDDVVT